MSPSAPVSPFSGHNADAVADAILEASQPVHTTPPSFHTPNHQNHLVTFTPSGLATPASIFQKSLNFTPKSNNHHASMTRDDQIHHQQVVTPLRESAPLNPNISSAARPPLPSRTGNLQDSANRNTNHHIDSSPRAFNLRFRFNTDTPPKSLEKEIDKDTNRQLSQSRPPPLSQVNSVTNANETPQIHHRPIVDPSNSTPLFFADNNRIVATPSDLFGKFNPLSSMKTPSTFKNHSPSTALEKAATSPAFSNHPIPLTFSATNTPLPYYKPSSSPSASPTSDTTTPKSNSTDVSSQSPSNSAYNKMAKNAEKETSTSSETDSDEIETKKARKTPSTEENKKYVKVQQIKPSPIKEREAEEDDEEDPTPAAMASFFRQRSARLSSPIFRKISTNTSSCNSTMNNINSVITSPVVRANPLAQSDIDAAEIPPTITPIHIADIEFSCKSGFGGFGDIGDSSGLLKADLDLGVRAARIPLPYAIRLRLTDTDGPINPMGARIERLLEGPQSMYLSVIDNNKKGKNKRTSCNLFFGNSPSNIKNNSKTHEITDLQSLVQMSETGINDDKQIDMYYLFWAAPDTFSKHGSGRLLFSVTDEEYADYEIPIDIQVESTQPIISVQTPDYSNREVRAETNVTFDEHELSKEISIAIWNESEGQAPLLLNIVLEEDAGGTFSINQSNHEQNQCIPILLESGSSQSFCTRFTLRPELTLRDRYYGSVLIKYAFIEQGRSPPGQDLELNQYYDHVINLTASINADNVENEHSDNLVTPLSTKSFQNNHQLQLNEECICSDHEEEHPEEPCPGLNYHTLKPAQHDDGNTEEYESTNEAQDSESKTLESEENLLRTSYPKTLISRSSDMGESITDHGADSETNLDTTYSNGIEEEEEEEEEEQEQEQEQDDDDDEVEELEEVHMEKVEEEKTEGSREQNDNVEISDVEHTIDQEDTSENHEDGLSYDSASLDTQNVAVIQPEEHGEQSMYTEEAGIEEIPTEDEIEDDSSVKDFDTTGVNEIDNIQEGELDPSDEYNEYILDDGINPVSSSSDQLETDMNKLNLSDDSPDAEEDLIDSQSFSVEPEISNNILQEYSSADLVEEEEEEYVTENESEKGVDSELDDNTKPNGNLVIISEQDELTTIGSNETERLDNEAEREKLLTSFYSLPEEENKNYNPAEANMINEGDEYVLIHSEEVPRERVSDDGLMDLVNGAIKEANKKLYEDTPDQPEKVQSGQQTNPLVYIKDASNEEESQENPLNEPVVTTEEDQNLAVEALASLQFADHELEKADSIDDSTTFTNTMTDGGRRVSLWKGPVYTSEWKADDEAQNQSVPYEAAVITDNATNTNSITACNNGGNDENNHSENIPCDFSSSDLNKGGSLPNAPGINSGFNSNGNHEYSNQGDVTKSSMDNSTSMSLLGRPKLKLPRPVRENGVVMDANKGTIELPVLNATPEVVEVSISMEARGNYRRHLDNTEYANESAYSTVNTTVTPNYIVIGAGEKTTLTIQRTSSNAAESLLVLRSAVMNEKNDSENNTINRKYYGRVTYRIPTHVKKSIMSMELKEEFSVDRPTMSFYNPLNDSTKRWAVRLRNGTLRSVRYKVWISEASNGQSLNDQSESIFKIISPVKAVIQPERFTSIVVEFNNCFNKDEVKHFHGRLNIHIGSQKDFMPLFAFTGQSNIKLRCNDLGYVCAENNGNRYGFIIITGPEISDVSNSNKSNKDDINNVKHVLAPGEEREFIAPYGTGSIIYTGDEIARSRQRRAEELRSIENNDMISNNLFNDEFEGEDLAQHAEGYDWSAEDKFSMFYSGRLLDHNMKRYVFNLNSNDSENGLSFIETNREIQCDWNASVENGVVHIENLEIQKEIQFHVEGAEPSSGVIAPLGDALLNSFRETIEVRAEGRHVTLHVQLPSQS